MKKIAHDHVKRDVQNHEQEEQGQYPFRNMNNFFDKFFYSAHTSP